MKFGESPGIMGKVIGETLCICRIEMTNFFLSKRRGAGGQGGAGYVSNELTCEQAPK